jgi:hypothetical protein
MVLAQFGSVRIPFTALDVRLMQFLQGSWAGLTTERILFRSFQDPGSVPIELDSFRQSNGKKVGKTGSAHSWTHTAAHLNSAA